MPDAHVPTHDLQGQATYGTANLRQRTTGLPFIVFISQRDGARDDVRVKVSPAPRVREDQMSSYGVRPFEHKAGPPLSFQEEKKPKEWTAANLQVLIEYWEEDIEYTEDAIDLLVKV